MAEPGGVGGPGGERPHPERVKREEEDRAKRGQVALVPDPNRLRWGRAFVTGVSMILGLALIAAIAVWVLTGTDWGRERVRRYAQNMINGMIHGRARIGKLSGNLLTGMVVHDFSITDSAGAPFVAVESFRGNYAILALLRKRISVDQAIAVRPVIVLDRPPGGVWNWQRIFPRDTTPKPATQQTNWGDWLRFTNASVQGGQVVVRSPWRPSEKLSARARDSVVRDVMRGGGRLMIQAARGGFQKIVQLDTINASIPLLRLSQPGVKNRLLEVSALSMVAYPFRPPAAVVRDLKGIFPFNNDSIWWKGAVAQMPASKASGNGAYNFSSGDMWLTIHSDPTSFADVRWIYPRLPSDGRGALDLKLLWKGAVQDYQVTNANVTMAGAHATGAIGITIGDTIAIHNTDLRFAGLQTRTLEQLISGFKSPRRGTLAGHAIVSGGRNALAVNGDITFDDVQAGTSRITAVGGVGFPGHGMRATNLRVRMLPVQVALAKTWMPTLPIGGTVTGDAVVSGATDRQLDIQANIDHRDRGTRSVIDGKAVVRLAGTQFYDVDARARPISLEEVGRFFPTAGLQGSAAGPFHVTGPLSDLKFSGDFRLPDGGRLGGRGTFDLASKEKGYDLTARLVTFNARTIDSKAPITSLTANVSAKGRGFALATMRATLAADLSTSRWDSLAVDTASVRASIASGLLDVRSLFAAGAHTAARAQGTFGLVRGTNGTLKFDVAVDSLGAFNRWIPRQPGATTAIAPRPGRVAQAIAKAKADSARVARATEMQRIITGRPGPQLVVNAPKPVPADTVSGTAYAAGTLSGNLYDFDLRGRAGGERVNVRGNFVRRFQSEFVWTNARTPASNLVLAVDADSVSAMGFGFDSMNLRVTYKSPGGHVELAVLQDQQRRYMAKGDYALYPDRKELRLADMTLRFDTTYWAMTRPSAIEWGGPGIRVTDLELKNRGTGRVYANGLLPTNGVANFRLDVDNFPISNITDITQTDIDATGIFAIHGTMTGTLADPVYRGAFGVVQGTYNGTPVPDLRGRFEYANEELTAHADALRPDGRSMTTADGRIPINLALSGVTGDRLLPRPMSVDVVGDSLPINLLPQFTSLVSDVQGHAAGRLAMRGTLRRPSLTGGLILDHGTATLTTTGARIEDIGASIRMVNDTVFVDSLAGWAKGPLRVTGTLAVGSWREPAFNLKLTSGGAELLNNKYGKVRVDANVAFAGPFNGASLTGSVRVTQGVIYAPEPTGRHLIGAGDPAMFSVLDTAMATERDLFPPTSPLLANLSMRLSLDVNHNTWVRNREANVEIYTDDPLIVHAEQQAFDITGVVTTDRGEYSFLSKRFQIKRGSAMFIGSPDLNPTLQITGEYQVEVASRAALDIRVQIGGTLKKPKLSLESDAQPPRTQSELLSLLAFGQSTESLLGSGSSSIAGSAATSDLFGVGAQVAVRRLAGVALGVAVDQVQIQAGKTFGTDVFDITPGDMPSGNVVGNILTQTKFEAGKYINPRTYLSVQEQAARLGIGLEHRTSDGWHFSASAAPRILLQEPRLNSQPIRTVQSYGGFILREWRF